MTISTVRATAQQETVIEKVYREVFMKEGDCRFTLEVRTSDKKIQHYGLHSVSKPSAQAEAQEKIQLLLESLKDDRIIWRMSGESVWTFETAKAVKNELPREKKMSMFGRLIEKFFYIEDDEDE